MKSFAMTLEPGSSTANHTGSWRTKRPVYTKNLPPCNKTCPAGENIQEWLALAETGAYEAAWHALVNNNPLPAVMGRVCYHTCEGACNRKEIDTPVRINSVERFLGDEAIKRKWEFAKPAKASGKKVLVVGAGPAGLSAAYQLARLGHKVTICEALSQAGGMMRYGIPTYRLPRTILDAEIDRILALGVELKLNADVKDVSQAKKDGKYDAVFMAVGAQVAKTTSIATSNGARILDAVSVLRAMESDTKPDFGKRVAVYGGGNTALDVARTAIRRGADEVTIVYRRTREKMPALPFEVDEALEEGIKIRFLSTIKSADGSTLTLEKMTLDEKGGAAPTGNFEKMEADCVVLALGQDADLSLVAHVQNLDKNNGIVSVDASQRTSCEGLFAGGDMASNARTVTAAIGHGKKAARHIDAWLRKDAYETSKPHDASADRLNKWYYEKVPEHKRPVIDMTRRKTSFAEVEGGLTQEQALAEARRCLSCGNCFECDNCYSLCPDNAIEKLGEGKGFAVKSDYCKGCGICAAECPCGAIDMVAEDI